MKVKRKKRRKIPTADILCKIEESPATGSWIFKRFRNIGGLDIYRYLEIETL